MGGRSTARGPQVDFGDLVTSRPLSPLAVRARFGHEQDLKRQTVLAQVPPQDWAPPSSPGRGTAREEEEEEEEEEED